MNDGTNAGWDEDIIRFGAGTTERWHRIRDSTYPRQFSNVQSRHGMDDDQRPGWPHLGTVAPIFRIFPSGRHERLHGRWWCPLYLFHRQCRDVSAAQFDRRWATGRKLLKQEKPDQPARPRITRGGSPDASPHVATVEFHRGWSRRCLTSSVHAIAG
jgi:hypothetical protein